MDEDSCFKAFLLYLLARCVIALVVFARLAIHADKWWIVLFSVLFLPYLKQPYYSREENNDEDF